jgi:CubicO group peptidase (beta-lactamase class C family)
MKKLKVLYAALMLFAAPAAMDAAVPSKAQDDPDKVISAFMKRWNIEGASVAITKDGQMIYNQAFGVANSKTAEPVSSHSVFRIASVSKPITSVAIMKLIGEGKLSLDSKVFGKGNLLDSPYYLDVIDDERIYSITVQQLLEHTSGWDREMPCDGFLHSDPAFYPLHVSEVLHEPNPVGDSALVKFSLLRGLHHQPGTYYSYSNVGYLVLGKIIEKLAGMKYEEYVSAEILSPLGMQSTHLGRNREKLENEVCYNSDYTTLSAYGDGEKVQWQYGGFNLEAMNAHGGWVSSASDLTILLNSLEGTKILDRDSYQEMAKRGTVNPGYAKGWFTNSAGTIWHTGSLDGSASYVCKTNNGYTWAFLLNSRADNSAQFWKEFDRLPWDCISSPNLLAMVE